MIDKTASAVIARCNELKTYWNPRNDKFRRWYRLLEMVDELKTEKMESFVGNDPRAMYNLILHMLDTDIPHRLESFDSADLNLAGINESLSKFFDKAWAANERRYRKSGPRQSLKRDAIGFMLATGWLVLVGIVTDSGNEAYSDPWNPADVFPMWDFYMGLSEVAHIYRVPVSGAMRMCSQNGWPAGHLRGTVGDVTIYDYWLVDWETGFPIIWNAVCVGNTANSLAKFVPTRFKAIPVYITPVGGLPDTGSLSEGSPTSYQSSFNAGVTAANERWKEEIGQAVIATNENIYRAWNKWWTFSLQLLRDTAQPRILERSKSGKAIVRPEDVFRRGAIFRAGLDESVEFIGAPPVPLELRSTQLDLEAMMQRGGPNWAMYGNVGAQVSTYVMSQIAASANQVISPFKKALEDTLTDIDNDWLDDIRERGVKPYGWSLPKGFKSDMKVSAKFEVEIPGDLVQRATVARMLDPDFQLSYTYVMGRLFPDIKNPMLEKARINADRAERSPENAIIAAIVFYRKQAAFLSKNGDIQAAKLYEMAASAAEAQLRPQQPAEQAQSRTIGTRTEGAPPSPSMPVT